MDAAEIRKRLLLPETRVLGLDPGDREMCMSAIADYPRLRWVSGDVADRPPPRTMLDRFFLAPAVSDGIIDVVLMPTGVAPTADMVATGPFKIVTFIRKNDSGDASDASDASDVVLAADAIGRSERTLEIDVSDPSVILGAMLLRAAASWDCIDFALGSVAEEYGRRLAATISGPTGKPPRHRTTQRL